MSKEAVLQLFRIATEDPEIRLQFRSITGVKELVKLGERNGYSFSSRDLAEASSAPSFPGAPGPSLAQIPKPAPSPESGSRLLHYEWCLDDLPGFEAVARELPLLKIKPSTVDLRAFREHTRRDDRDFADMSPASPGFRERYDALMKSEAGVRTAFGRRSFHLVDLDEHVDHDQYDSYFRAKMRLVAALERLLGDEVRFSGSMWYPPNGYRAWHTNETQPGWRMYLIDFDAGPAEIAGRSFFRYMNPQTGELVTLDERPGLLRLFKIEQESDKLLWHCIVNDSPYSRWSLGFMVSESWMNVLR